MAAFLKPGSGVEETANAVHTYEPGGKAPNEYDVFRNPDLAHTYRMIAAGGRDAFYDGPIADTIDAYFKRIGGWLSKADLREHQAEWPEPLVTTYRGVDVYGMGANTQGLAHECLVLGGPLIEVHSERRRTAATRSERRQVISLAP